ncbi:MAG: glycosyltransferase family 39 protein [Chitinispirillaceae bacterium]|nr:glycosyltransferase family 39 protein [Chitinispirillaceae bacterium]
MSENNSVKKTHPQPTGIQWGIFFLILVFALTIRINVAAKHIFPRGDEGQWLRLASRLPAADFFMSNVVDHDLGQPRCVPRVDATRDPLFPVLIYISRLFTHNIFRAGQIATIVGYAFFHLLFVVGLYRFVGFYCALSASTILSCSPFLITLSATVYPDLIFAAAVVVFLWHSDRFIRTRIAALIAGLMCGAVFLLKASGLFLLPVFLLICLVNPDNPDRWIKCICFVAAFCILAVPWMIRNALITGTPFIYSSLSQLLFKSYGEGSMIGAKLPGAAEYLRSLSVGSMALRFCKGVVNVLKDFGYFDHNLSLASLPFAVAGVWHVRGRKEKLMPVLLFSAFYFPVICFAAYIQWVGRFLVMYYIWIYALCGIGAYRIGLFVHNRYLQPVVTLLCTAAVLLTVVYPIEFYSSVRGDDWDKDLCARQMVAIVAETVPPSEAVLSSWLFHYAFMHRVNTISVLPYNDPRDFHRFLKDYNTRFAVLDTTYDSALLSQLAALPFMREMEEISRRGEFVFYRIRLDGLPD